MTAEKTGRMTGHTVTYDEVVSIKENNVNYWPLGLSIFKGQI